MRAVRLRKYVTPAAHTSCDPIGARRSAGSGGVGNGACPAIVALRKACRSSRLTRASHVCDGTANQLIAELDDEASEGCRKVAWSGWMISQPATARGGVELAKA